MVANQLVTVVLLLLLLVFHHPICHFSIGLRRTTVVVIIDRIVELQMLGWLHHLISRRFDLFLLGKHDFDLNIVEELLRPEFLLGDGLDQAWSYRQALLLHHGFVLFIELGVMHTINSLFRRLSGPGLRQQLGDNVFHSLFFHVALLLKLLFQSILISSKLHFGLIDPLAEGG